MFSLECYNVHHREAEKIKQVSFHWGLAQKQLSAGVHPVSQTFASDILNAPAGKGREAFIQLTCITDPDR